MKNNEDEQLKRLKTDLEKLESVHEPEVPQTFQLMKKLNEFKGQRKKAWKRELFAFIAIALIILSSYSVIVFRSPEIFVWIQVAAMITVPVIYSAEKKRRSALGEVADDGK